MKEDLNQFFNALDRSYFMDSNKEYAHLDRAIAIGYESQTAIAGIGRSMASRFTFSD